MGRSRSPLIGGARSRSRLGGSAGAAGYRDGIGGSATSACRAEAAGVAYEWWLELSAVSDGKTEHFRIPQSGGFRTPGLPSTGLAWIHARKPQLCKVAQ